MAKTRSFQLLFHLASSNQLGVFIKNAVVDYAHGKGIVGIVLEYGEHSIRPNHPVKFLQQWYMFSGVNMVKHACGVGNVKASLGEQKRQAGGLALRTGTKPTDKPSDKATPRTA